MGIPRARSRRVSLLGNPGIEFRRPHCTLAICLESWKVLGEINERKKQNFMKHRGPTKEQG